MDETRKRKRIESDEEEEEEMTIDERGERDEESSVATHSTKRVRLEGETWRDVARRLLESDATNEQVHREAERLRRAHTAERRRMQRAEHAAQIQTQIEQLVRDKHDLQRDKDDLRFALDLARKQNKDLRARLRAIET